MEYIKIKDWGKTQHYKKRRPPWIRLYTYILDKYDDDGKPKKFYKLPDDAKLTFIMLLCASSRFNNNIPFDNASELASILAIKTVNLQPLLEADYIQIVNDASTDDSKDANKVLLPETETETETEKNEGYALPSQEIISEASEPKIIEEINKIADILYEQKIFPKVHAFKNTMLKRVKNPRAILYVLSACFTARPEDPWPYCEKIMQKENGNFNERDFRKTTE